MHSPSSETHLSVKGCSFLPPQAPPGSPLGLMLLLTAVPGCLGSPSMPGFIAEQGPVMFTANAPVSISAATRICVPCFHHLILIILKLGISMHKFGERCDLIQEGGRITDPTIDKRMDFHFNALLDVVSEWRKDKTQLQDVPLGGMGTGCPTVRESLRRSGERVPSCSFVSIISVWRAVMSCQ